MQGQETGWGSLRHALEHSTENPLLYSPTGVRVHSNNDPNWEGTVSPLWVQQGLDSQAASSSPRLNLFKPTQKRVNPGVTLQGEGAAKGVCLGIQMRPSA